MYDDYDEPRHECYECKRHDKVFMHAGDFIQSLVNRLYNHDQCDIYRIESDLDELCHMFNIVIPDGEMQVQRKPSKVNFLNHWQDFNREELAKAANQ